MEDDLPGRYSEGILLLPEAWGTAEDAVIVASLYGMLHKVRSRKQAQMCNKSKMSRLRKAFSKYSMRRAATQAV